MAIDCDTFDIQTDCKYQQVKMDSKHFNYEKCVSWHVSLLFKINPKKTFCEDKMPSLVNWVKSVENCMFHLLSSYECSLNFPLPTLNIKHNFYLFTFFPMYLNIYFSTKKQNIRCRFSHVLNANVFFTELSLKYVHFTIAPCKQIFYTHKWLSFVGRKIATQKLIIKGEIWKSEKKMTMKRKICERYPFKMFISPERSRLNKPNSKC